MSNGLDVKASNAVIPLEDPCGRPVKSLRLSVTQRCDLRCSHCHREGQRPSNHEMTPPEIERLVAIASSLGIRKVKITGGEPLARDDLPGIISHISPLTHEVSLTTNGVHLAETAVNLKEAGLKRVNVSLHSLSPDRYARLCGVDRSQEVVQGIEAAVAAGLSPVKVNMVVLRGQNEDEIPAMMDFCARAGAALQLIEYEADREDSNGCVFKERFVSLEPVEKALASVSVESSTNELHQRNRYVLQVNGRRLMVEVVRPMHNTIFCSNCTRIRMSSDGRLKPCLLDRTGDVDVLGPLRDGASDAELRALFIKAVCNRRPYWS